MVDLFFFITDPRFTTQVPEALDNLPPGSRAVIFVDGPKNAMGFELVRKAMERPNVVMGACSNRSSLYLYIALTRTRAHLHTHTQVATKACDGG